MTPTPQPAAEETSEKIVIDGKEIDLGANTRSDLIHFLRIHVAHGESMKKNYLDAQRIIGILLRRLGGEVVIAEDEMDIDGSIESATNIVGKMIRFIPSSTLP